MSFIKKRTMERIVLYFMFAIVQHVEDHAMAWRSTIVRSFCMGSGDKKRAANAARSNMSLDLSPQVIIGRSALETILRTVFIKHTLKDRHIAWSHINNLKTDVVGIRIHMVRVTPFAAGNKHHGVFIGD